MNRSPIKILVLARLLAASDKGETEKNLSKDLKPLVEHRWQGADWADRLGAVLGELESSGVVGRIRKGKTTRLALTAEGRRLALEALGVDELPPKTTWAKVKSSYLPAIALGRPGPVGADLKVEILRARYGLDLVDGKPSMAQATEKMAAKLLGLEAGQKFTADNILRKLLRDAGIELPAGQKPSPSSIREALFRRELGDPSARKPLDLLATRSVGARQNTASELGSAVLRSWVDRSETGAESRPASIALEDFARLVTRAARESPSGWFGDAKVFISHVRRALRDDPAFRGVDDATFKDRLVEAHRARLIELGRADLVEAMDPADVRESATPYLNAVYHFVRTEEAAR
jgi:hypothetical protein